MLWGDIVEGLYYFALGLWAILKWCTLFIVALAVLFGLMWVWREHPIWIYIPLAIMGVIAIVVVIIVIGVTQAEKREEESKVHFKDLPMHWRSDGDNINDRDY